MHSSRYLKPSFKYSSIGSQFRSSRTTDVMITEPNPDFAGAAADGPPASDHLKENLLLEICQVTSTRPKLDSAPYLAAFVANS